MRSLDDEMEELLRVTARIQLNGEQAEAMLQDIEDSLSPRCASLMAPDPMEWEEKHDLRRAIGRDARAGNESDVRPVPHVPVHRGAGRPIG